MKFHGSRTRQAASAGAAFLMMLGTAAAVAPVANAEEGRRVCVYSSSTGTNSFPIWAMDWRKTSDSSCPENKNSVALRAGALTKTTESITCQGFASNFLGVSYDPCPRMNNDIMYKITKNGSDVKYEDNGHY
ncbi:hypothetical protein [Amycolatopsis sp. NPDC059657]|uniref:hypothetical protein n=1 Tax=Amycolatopsis sp. NPDC059657 TaxID=3346899 RepID=UPI00366D2EE0